jgi:ureidoglycolate dehydrogenase (NAD+)
MIKVDHNKFKLELLKVLNNNQLPYDVAKEIVESLITTSLRGVDSHGINLFPHYYQELISNRININPSIKFENTSKSTCIIDADNCFGHYAGAVAIEKCMSLAKTNGISITIVKNSNHFGAAAYFTEKAAKQNMISFAFCNTEALVNPYNSKESFLGTNPFCFSAPMNGEDSFCLDMATSTVPWNKIKNYRLQNKNLESGWALDKNGLETLDPNLATSLTPFGSYKGFGIGSMIEILCSGLSGGPMSKDIAPLYDLNIENHRKISHCFIVIDISKLIDINLFKLYMTNFSSRIRNLPSNCNEEVMLAGDKEKKCYSKRVKDGIPIQKIKFKEFLNISQNFNTTTI